MLHVVKHRSASGRLDAMWDYDPARRLVDLVLRLGSALPIDMRIPVASVDCGRIEAYAIVREDDESWRILPSIFVPIAASTLELRRVDRPICIALGRGDQILLRNTPKHVDLELEALAVELDR